MIPAELQQPILERAGGNPLYAEEFVRLLRDRDLLVEGSSWQLRAGAEVPFPDSVQALIAARLDTLEPEAKSLLADAAVIGKVFWAGAVAAMGDRDPPTVTTTLRELSRKELVRPSRRSSMEGEAEYAFWHVLARDVAYNQLPRASRASRHVAAAAWIESKAPERVEDLADVLAYHYATALELARAAGRHRPGRRAGGTGAALPRPRRGARTRAGHRRGARELRAGARAHARGHPDRAAALARFGEAAAQAGRYGEAKDALEEAIDAFRRRVTVAEPPGDGHARPCAAAGWGIRGGWELPAQALALLEPLRPARSSSTRSPKPRRARRCRGAPRPASTTPSRRSRWPTSSACPGLPAPSATAAWRAATSVTRVGWTTIREAIALATAGRTGPRGRAPPQQLAFVALGVRRPGAALEVLRAGIAFAQPRGLTEMAEPLTATSSTRSSRRASRSRH